MATVAADWLRFEDTRFTATSFSRAWVAAVATYGVGDVVTTLALVYFSDVHTEANPVVRQSIEAFGGGGFLGLKLLVMYACLGASLWAGLRDDDPWMFYGPPYLLALVGLFTTLHNLALLAG